MKKNILHYGLQRSGTNFLRAILNKNYNIRIFNSDKDMKHPLQKHFRPYDEKELIPHEGYRNNFHFNHFSDFEKALDIPEKIDGIVVISKDPYSWLISYKDWGRRGDWPKVGHHYIEEYNHFYAKWVAFKKDDNRISFLKYRDLLLNTKNELRKIEDKFDLQLKTIRKITGRKTKLIKVKVSKHFTQSKLDYYSKKEYLKKYDDEDLKIINEMLDKDLMCELGYEIVETTRG